ncbi:MAG: response regulator transcription factor [Anaerolineae bacterium]|nr:response regulator transcription factor [Anaerolineae bacterium]
MKAVAMVSSEVNISVVIVDDNADVRQALRLLCEQSLGMGVRGEIDSLAGLVAHLETLERGIILFDWGLARDVNEAKFLFLRLHKVARSFIVVLGSRPETRADAVAAGADAFVYKGDPPEHLLNLLQAFKYTRRP